MGKRYCTKDNYLHGYINHNPLITEEELRAMKEAERRVGWGERFTLGDCKITAVTKQWNDLIIDFDNSGGYTRYQRLILQNGQIVEQEYPLVGSIFLHHDLYYEKDKKGLFTFYCLMWSPESQETAGLGYLTLTATYIKMV